MIVPFSGAVFQILFSMLLYVIMLLLSLPSKKVRSDLRSIGYDPFNTDEDAVLRSEKVSFYKGVPVIRIKGRRSGTFGGIWLTRSEKSIDVVKHERGHSTQLMMMGLATFVFTVAIPSAACLGHHYYRKGDSPEINYYRTPWETMADLLGGAGSEHCRSEKKTAWIYYGLSFLILPAVIFWR